MPSVSPPSKGALALKTVKGAAKRPRAARRTVKAAWPVAKLGVKVGKPFVKRRVRLSGEQFVEVGANAIDVATTALTTLAVYAPVVASELGLVELETPKSRRTTPSLVAGVVIGAGAMYLLDPAAGEARRKQVTGMVGKGSGDQQVPAP